MPCARPAIATACGRDLTPTARCQRGIQPLEMANNALPLASLPICFPFSGPLRWRLGSQYFPVRVPLSMEMLCHE